MDDKQKYGMDRPQFDEQMDNNDSICPYCGDRYQVESEDYDEDGREVQCGSCGNKYWECQSFSVTTHTRPDCQLNGLKHDYERVVTKSGTAFFCRVCNDCSID